MHQLLGVYKLKGLVLVSLLANAAPPTDNNGVKIALISAFGIILAACITAIFATFRKDPTIVTAPMPSTVTDYIAELVRRATEAEHRATMAEGTLSAKDKIIHDQDIEVDRLTRLLLLARIDPATGKPLPSRRAGGT